MNQLAMFGILLTIILGYVGYKYNDMSNQIEYLQHNLELNISKNNQNVLELALLKGNENRLKQALDEVNKQLKQISLDKEDIEKKFEDYKNLPLDKKVTNKELLELLKKDDQFKKTCEYGLQLNKKISGLKYEDL